MEVNPDRIFAKSFFLYFEENVWSILSHFCSLPILLEVTEWAQRARHNSKVIESHVTSDSFEFLPPFKMQFSEFLVDPIETFFRFRILDADYKVSIASFLKHLIFYMGKFIYFFV